MTKKTSLKVCRLCFHSRSIYRCNYTHYLQYSYDPAPLNISGIHNLVRDLFVRSV